MNRTGIEYGDFGWNFYPGCLHKPQGICKVERCWAEGMSKRQRQDFHNPHLIPERLLDPLSRRKPSRILVNFMGDLFGDWVDPNMLLELSEIKETYRGTNTLRHMIFKVINACPQHTFLFLTKNPKGLIPWSPFPSNCYVGVSVTGPETLGAAIYHLRDIDVKVKFLSFEPLLRSLRCDRDFEARMAHYFKTAGINWAIIGAQTKPYKPPQIDWVLEIIEACDKARIPLFLKDNLTGDKDKALEAGLWGLARRQEMPDISH